MEENVNQEQAVNTETEAAATATDENDGQQIVDVELIEPQAGENNGQRVVDAELEEDLDFDRETLGDFLGLTHRS